MEINLSACMENLVNMADYLLALQGKKSESNTFDNIEKLSNLKLQLLENILSELQDYLDEALFDLINTLMSSHGLEYMDYEKETYYNELYTLILEKGKFGYNELLKICKMDHMEFCTIKI